MATGHRSLDHTKQGANRERWLRVAKDKALAILLPKVIVETQGEVLLTVLKIGKVSTNVYLRRLHNFCVDMNWLPWPLIPKRQWPSVMFKDKRAITWEEHIKIVERERNPELKTFYQLAWQIGASQSDLALLEAESIDWENMVIAFTRNKTGTPVLMSFDDQTAVILRMLPKSGPLFPNLQAIRAGHRASEFKRRCNGLGIKGVSLHSYRYAWAERARVAGMPERFAQEALGHNSKAVTRAYAKRAKVKVPPLSEYERQRAKFLTVSEAPLKVHEMTNSIAA